MTPDIGRFALALAIVVFIGQAVTAVQSMRRDRAPDVSIRATYAGAALLFVSFTALIAAFVASDFSLSVVAANSHVDKPLAYKIAGAWGNHEGSMLLWCLVLACVNVGVAIDPSLSPRLRSGALAVIAALSVAFCAFAIFASSPFERLAAAPLEGAGLNPLLQDPALAAHPPMLYLGYVGLAAPFAIAVAGLWSRETDRGWARAMRRWTLLAFVPLTLGIGLGAYWAYYELGWGGWWFWDPVENASFMPWLCAVALLHSAIVTERRGAFPAWTALLAILAFGFSMTGAFLTRSGILTSVHAFAVSPQRGLLLLLILAISIGAALALFAVRARALRRSGETFEPVSRESALLANNFIFVSATIVLFYGTVFPLISEVVLGAPATVGPPYFELTVLPVIGVGLAAAPIAAVLAWGRADLFAAMKRYRIAGAMTAATLAAALLAPITIKLGAAVAGALGIWLIAASATDLLNRAGLRPRGIGAIVRLRNFPRSAFVAGLAHASVGLFIIGAAADAAFPIEQHALLAEGDSMRAAGRELTLASVRQRDGPNYAADRAEIAVSDAPQHPLRPERRYYPASGDNTTEVAIRSSVAGDLYVALGPPVETDTIRWSVRVTFNPVIWAVFLGVAAIAASGAIALSTPRPTPDVKAKPK